ncbi:MAG: hypothetical protein WC156_15835 [Pedobacter sp.]
MIPDFYMDSLSIDFSPSVEKHDFVDVVSKIKKRQQVILFKSYWSHEAVKTLSSDYLDNLNDEDLKWYIHFLLSMVESRINTHWVERINIFHSFGLAARKNSQFMSNIIREKYLPRCNNKINNFVDYSAINMVSFSGNSIFSSFAIIEKLMENIKLMQGIGNYNINYYGNVIELSNVMRSYLGTSKESIVPQTIASTLSAMIGTDYDEEEVDSVQDLLSRLDKRTRVRINKLYRILI